MLVYGFTQNINDFNSQCMQTYKLYYMLLIWLNVFLSFSTLQGDLKSYLIEQENKLPVHKERKLLLHFAVDVACGLACLHRHNYVHW